MRRALFLLVGLSLFGCLLVPAAASADVNNFAVTSFTADETLNRRDPQGELRVVERIEVDFADYNHGILRALPERYKNHSLQLHINKVSSDTGAPAAYTTYGSNGNTVLKIGDPKRTVTGSQQYTIDYTLHNVITFQSGHDELYWDVNGTQWQQPFTNVTAILHLPDGLRQTRQPVCYTGYQDSTARDCTANQEGRTVTVMTTGPLSANQTLTFAAGFEKGYFTPAHWYETAAEYLRPVAELAVPVLLIGGGSFWYWWRHGRDPKGRGVVIPQYNAPADLTPAEAGAVVDFKLDNRDITATIIDLSIRGYLKIIETTQVKALRKDTVSYELQLVKSDFSALSASERQLLSDLFTTHETGEVIDISALQSKLYTTAQMFRKDVEGSLTSRGYFRSNPLHAGKTLTAGLTICIVAVFCGAQWFGGWTAAGIIIGAVIGCFCAAKLAARTRQGVGAKEHILGLKRYLEVAEKDRIEALQSPRARYAQPSVEPARTVDLFEKLLPYAIVLGVEQQWAAQFEGLYQTPPDWYSGHWTTFNSYYLASTLNSGFGSAVNTAFSAPSNSGGSGFSGGFSGGGGGGGGGGGW